MGADEEKEVQPEEEFDAAFDEETPTEDEPKPDEEAKDDDDTGESDKKGEGEDDKPSSDDDDDVDWQKRFKDTQSWGTKLSQENKDLTERIEKLESGKSEEPDESQKKSWDDFKEGHGKDFKEVLNDYDLEEPFKAIFEMSQSGEGGTAKPDEKLMERIESAETAAQLARFDLAITSGYIDEKGKYIKGHADAVEIFAKKEYGAYHEKELSAGNPLLQSNNPADAIKFIGQFKEEVLKIAAEEHDAEAKDRAKETDEALESTVDAKNRESKASGTSGTSIQEQQDDFDKAFDEVEVT